MIKHSVCMEIKINKVGLILEGEEKGRYVKIVDDSLNTGGYLIYTYNSLDLKTQGYQCYDSWVETSQDIQNYFNESSWKILWLPTN
jgi:hypothetical protein